MSDCVKHVERKARKAHKCEECSNGIEKGSVYHAFSGIFDNNPFDHKMCAGCHKVMEHLISQHGIEYNEIILGEIGLGIYEHFNMYHDLSKLADVSFECDVTISHLESMYK